MSARVLAAGAGSIFFGDDTFGSEVARRLQQEQWPGAEEMEIVT